MSSPPPNSTADSPARPTAITVEDGRGGRADAAVRFALPERSRREIAAVFDRGGVVRDGRSLKRGDDVHAGDHLTIDLDEGPFVVPEKETALEVVFEDADFVVVNKPPGIACHPLERGERGTALGGLIAAYPEIAVAGEDEREGGLVHRLDTWTGGALAAARNRDAWHRARNWFSTPVEPEIEGAAPAERAGRAYLAVVDDPNAMFEARSHTRGWLQCASPIAHHPGDSSAMVVVEGDTKHRGNPRAAVTRARLVARENGRALVVVTTEGGRRHQVRVHLANAAFPLCGDTLYGGAPVPAFASGQHALWAIALQLPNREQIIAPPVGVFARLLGEIDPENTWRDRLRSI